MYVTDFHQIYIYNQNPKKTFVITHYGQDVFLKPGLLQLFVSFLSSLLVLPSV